MELLSTIDSLRANDSWYAFESNVAVATGLGFGANQGDDCVKNMMKYYENNHFVINGKESKLGCPAINTDVLTRINGFVPNGKTQRIEGMLILSNSDYSKYAKHWGTMSWVEGIKPTVRQYKESKVKSFLRKPENFQFIEKYFGKKIRTYYTIIVYDFFECGVVYFLKRFIWKWRNRK